MISCSSRSRCVMSPFAVFHFAIRLVMCSFLHRDFLVLFSSVILSSPGRSRLISSVFACHLILVRRGKLISVIHTWSFFFHRHVLISPTPTPTPDIPLPHTWLAVELCFMKTVKTWKAGVWGGFGGFLSCFVCHYENKHHLWASRLRLDTLTY